jgi:hypothetical protein
MRCAIAFLMVVVCPPADEQAARDTGQMFDKYGCLAKELKG